MKKKLKWIIIGAAVVIAGIALYSTKTGGTGAQVLKVSKGEIKQYLEDTAHVKSLEQQTIYIEGSGKISDIRADAGDMVKKGDLLLSLDKTDLELQLKDAEAGIESAKAQLNGTELINYVNKIDMAKVAVDQAKIAYDSAQRDFENAGKLYEARALSKENFEKAQDTYRAASAALDSANLQLADVRQGAPEHLKAGYRAQLEQAVNRRDTILRSIQKQEVRAAMDGIILQRLVEKNSPVSNSTAAFVLGDINNLELQADILADDVNKVKLGNDVEISGKPIAEAVLKGKVKKIAPAAITVASALGINQKRVPVTIEMQGGAGLVKPGYDMDVKIITEVRSDTVVVPDSAVFDYKGTSHVFVIENGKAALRNVKKGIESIDFIEIREGLKEGDTILVKPDNTIKEGGRIKPSDINGKESGKAVQ